MSAMQGLEDALYQAEVAVRAAKPELNEHRDAMLTEAELVAMLDAYTEAGR
jgi:hypothetical protein